MNCIVMKRFLLLVAILSITSRTFLLGYIDAYSINSEKVIQELINSINQKRWNCFTELWNNDEKNILLSILQMCQYKMELNKLNP